MDLGDLWAARTTALHRRTTWGTHVRTPLTLAQAHRCSLSPHFCLTRLTPFSPEVRSGIKDVLMKTIQENRAHPSSGWRWGGGDPSALSLPSSTTWNSILDRSGHFLTSKSSSEMADGWTVPPSLSGRSKNKENALIKSSHAAGFGSSTNHKWTF